MSEGQQFKVVVSGNVIGDRCVEDVTEAFAKLLKLDASKASEFFNGKPRVIKKGTDKATATRFEKALTGIGVETSIVPVESRENIVAQREVEPAGAAALSLEPMAEPEQASERNDSAANSPTMICPGCNTLQPRAEQCPACGIFVEKAKHAQQFAQEVSESTTGAAAAAAGDGLSGKAVLSAAVAAFLGALLWMGIAIGFDYELGLIAWLIGGAVGFASAVTGARGSSAGAMCAVMALLAIFGGKFLAYQHFQQNIVQMMEEEAAWSDEEAAMWYEEAKTDAQLYVELDGSEQSLRQFMYDRNYTEAYSVDDITDAEVADFLEYNAANLEWMAAAEPSFEEWQGDVADEISRISTMDLLLASLGWMDALFLLLGLGTAYRLGDEGLPG